MTLATIKHELISHPSNSWAKDLGWKPVYTASKKSKIVVVGQAPGQKAQASHIPWNDKSGDTLRSWLGLNHDQFYDESKIALIPMDFYYPGKGEHGDNPPRSDFAPLWHPRLLALMPNVQLTILVGQYAQKYYLGSGAKRNLTETVRAYTEYLPKFLPLVHPSPLNFRWHSKNPWFNQGVLPKTKQLVHRLLN